MATQANGLLWRNSCTRRSSSTWASSRSCRWGPTAAENHHLVGSKALCLELKAIPTISYRWPAAGCTSWSRRDFRCRRSGSCCPDNRMPCGSTPGPANYVRMGVILMWKGNTVGLEDPPPAVFILNNYQALFNMPLKLSDFSTAPLFHWSALNHAGRRASDGFRFRTSKAASVLRSSLNIRRWFSN